MNKFTLLNVAHLFVLVFLALLLAIGFYVLVENMTPKRCQQYEIESIGSRLEKVTCVKYL